MVLYEARFCSYGKKEFLDCILLQGVHELSAVLIISDGMETEEYHK